MLFSRLGKTGTSFLPANIAFIFSTVLCIFQECYWSQPYGQLFAKVPSIWGKAPYPFDIRISELENDSERSGFVPPGEDCWGIPSMLTNISQMGVKWMEPGPFLWCSATKQGAVGINWNTGRSTQTWGKTWLWGWQFPRACGLPFPEDIQGNIYWETFLCNPP